MHYNRLAAMAVPSLLVLAVAGCTSASTELEGGSGTSTAAGAAGDGGGHSANATALDLTAIKPGPAAKLVPAKIKATGVLTVATNATFPPFEFIGGDNKTIVGFDADLAKAYAARMGLKVKMINTGFETILVGIQSHKYDAAMSGLAVTPQRRKAVDFVLYNAGGTGLGVPKGNPDRLSMDPMSMCGHTIGAPSGSIQGIKYLPTFSKQCTAAGKPAIKVRLYPSQTQANLAVTSGRSDGVMSPATPLNYEFHHSNIPLQLAPGKPYKPVDVGIGLGKGSGLAPAVSKAVKSLVADGTMRKIMAKWSVPASSLSPQAGKVIR